MIGWVSLHRKIKKHWIYSNAEYFKAWVTILLEVNHDPNTLLIDGELLKCDRSQSLNSLSTWCRILGKYWTIQKFRTFLKLLVKDKMISIEGLRKTTRLSVLNFNTYQTKQHTDNTEVTDRQHTDNTEVTTNNNDNNENNENKKYITVDKSTCLTFENFYNLYGNKKDRAKAEIAYKNVSEKDRQIIKDTLPRYLESTTLTEISGKGWKPKRKNPKTYLNSKSWLDEYEDNILNQKVEFKRNDNYNEALEEMAKIYQ